MPLLLMLTFSITDFNDESIYDLNHRYEVDLDLKFVYYMTLITSRQEYLSAMTGNHTKTVSIKVICFYYFIVNNIKQGWQYISHIA